MTQTHLQQIWKLIYEYMPSSPSCTIPDVCRISALQWPTICLVNVLLLNAYFFARCPKLNHHYSLKEFFFLFQYCSKCCWYSPNKMLLWLCMEFKNNLCYRWWRSMITYRKHYLNTIQNNLHFRHEYSVT